MSWKDTNTRLYTKTLRILIWIFLWKRPTVKVAKRFEGTSLEFSPHSIYIETFYMVHIQPTFYIHTNFLYGTCTHVWWRYIKLCRHIRYLHIAKNLVDGKEMYFWCRYIKLCQHISYLHIVRNILYSTYMEFW